MSPEHRAQLFHTVQELLREVGYERLTFDETATRARTSKATLYRQWGDKSSLVLAALVQDDARHPPLVRDVAITSLDNAFAQLSRSDRMSDRDLRIGFMLLHAASTDPRFAAELRTEIVVPLVAELSGVFEAAADRGEIERDSPLFAHLATVILTDLAFFAPLHGREATPADRERLFRPIVRPALTVAGSSPGVEKPGSSTGPRP